MCVKCWFLFILLSFSLPIVAQRVVPKKSKEEKGAAEQIRKRGKDQETTVEERWDPRTLSGKSKGVPEISA